MITSAQSTNDQLQTRGGARIASGRPLPAAVNQSQTFKLGRYSNSRSFYTHRLCLLPSRRRVSLHAILLPVCWGTRHPIRSLNGSRRLRPHTFEHQPPVKLIAAAPSHHQCLSKLSSLAGSINASKRFQKIGKVCQNGGSRDNRISLD